MLFLEQRVLALEGLQLLDLARRARWELHASRPPLEDAIAHFLSPARQHDGMDVEGIRDRLNLDPGHLAELHGRQFEFNAVAVNLPEAWLAHSTPPSVS